MTCTELCESSALAHLVLLTATVTHLEKKVWKNVLLWSSSLVEKFIDILDLQAEFIHYYILLWTRQSVVQIHLDICSVALNMNAYASTQTCWSTCIAPIQLQIANLRWSCKVRNLHGVVAKTAITCLVHFFYVKKLKQNVIHQKPNVKRPHKKEPSILKTIHKTLTVQTTWRRQWNTKWILVLKIAHKYWRAVFTPLYPLSN